MKNENINTDLIKPLADPEKQYWQPKNKMET